MVYQYERMPAKKEEETFYDELTRIHQSAVQIRTVIEHLDIYEEDLVFCVNVMLPAG